MPSFTSTATSTSQIVNNFSDKVLNDFDRIAVERGLISQSLLNYYNKQLKNYARAYSDPRGRTPEVLNDMVSEITSLSNEDKKSISDYIAAKSLISESLVGFEEALTLSTPKVRFKDFIKKTIENETRKGAPRERIIQLLKSAKNELEIHLTTTVHPTVFKTYDTITLQRNLSHTIESVANYCRQGAAVNTDSYSAISHNIDSFVKAAKDGMPMTHIEQVTTEEETKVEEENTEILSNLQNQVVFDGWNEAVKECVQENILNAEEANGLAFTENEMPFHKRTWNKADRDGREKTDSLSIIRAIMQNQGKDKKLDFRQNAEVHETLLSALIQVEFKRNSTFATFCRQFVTDLNEGPGGNWRSPESSIYQQLEKHKASFARMLILSNFKLVPPELVAHTVPFTTKYWELFDKFVTKEREKNSDIPPDVTFEGLAKYKDGFDNTFENLRFKFMQLVLETPIEFELNREKVKWHFKVGENGFNYRLDGYQGRPLFLQGKKKPGFSSESKIDLVTIGLEEREVLADTLRGMEIIRYFAQPANTVVPEGLLKPLGKDVISDRYEIANFSSVANFYEALLLFKETGVIKTKDNLVENADIDLLPLYETEEDFANAEKITEELLNDPLMLSYFKARGNKATVMLGFSDGAKSAGNAASELYWIPQTKKRIAEKFAAKGIIVDFKEGRGHIADRGGMLEPGLAQTQSPDIINKAGKHSATIQSDEPLECSISPTRGRDQMTSRMIGVMAAKISAETRTPEQKELMDLCEEAFKFITTLSSQSFQPLVRHHDEIADFLSKIPYNALASSRSAKRANSSRQSYEAMRAVPVALRFGLAKIPANSAGLREALEAFSSGETVKIGETTISSNPLIEKFAAYDKFPDFLGKHPWPEFFTPGQKALELLKKHPAFESFMMKTEAHLKANFDPVMANAWGAKTGHVSLVQNLCSSISGLIELGQSILRRLPMGNTVTINQSRPALELKTDRTLASAFCLASQPARMDKPEERPAALALRNALMVASGNDLTPDSIPRRMRDLPSRYAR